jgi:hypothetical protein
MSMAICSFTAPEYSGPRSLKNGDAGVELYVDPKTYVPLKEIGDGLPLFDDAQTWIEYKTLPITPANERLLSLVLAGSPNSSDVSSRSAATQ